MTPVRCLTARCRCTGALSGRANTIRSYLSLESCTCSCERIPGDFLIDVHCLGMLSQVIEARKAPVAMALKRPFTGVLSVNGQ